MANLLTVEAKKKLANERRSRKIVVALLLVEVLFLVAVVFNLALWFGFRLQKPALIPAPVVTKSTGTLSPEERQQAEGKLFQLTNWVTTKSWLSFIEKIVQVQPKTIKINQIAGLWTEKTNLSNLVISGQSTNRPDLVKFVDEIRKEKFFSRVDLPIEYLLSSSQGRFTLNLEIKNND